MPYLRIKKHGLDVENYFLQIANGRSFMHMFIQSSHFSMSDNRPRIVLFVIRRAFPGNDKGTPPIFRRTKDLSVAIYFRNRTSDSARVKSATEAGRKRNIAAQPDTASMEKNVSKFAYLLLQFCWYCWQMVERVPPSRKTNTTVSSD